MVKETKKYIEITPHKSLMIKVGQTGYNFQEGMAELIDNALDARYPNKKIRVEISVTSGQIVVKDDGIGMSEKEASESIRLGYSSKVGKLGEFGLGLKTSCNFLGEKFTIITKKKNNPEKYKIIFSENDWMENGDWFKFPFFIIKADSLEDSGTTVCIENLKIDIDDKISNKLKEELSVRFAPFIRNNELVFLFNGEECQYKEPRIIGEKRDINLTIDDCTVKGWWAYQLQGLNKSYYGFNTFRRGRIITIYDKIGLNPSQKIKQIFGELEIEGIPISHDKKSWQKGYSGYKKLEQTLREYFADFEPRPRKILSGYAASSGIVEGRVKRLNMFMHDPSILESEMNKIKKGDILITEMTRPHFLLAIRRSGAVITDMGGNLCHAAIMAREFNIPAVVGTQIATKTLKDNQRVIVDGNEGIVYES